MEVKLVENSVKLRDSYVYVSIEHPVCAIFTALSMTDPSFYYPTRLSFHNVSCEITYRLDRKTCLKF